MGAWPMRTRAIRTIAIALDVNERWIVWSNASVIDAEPLRHARAIIVEDDVGILNEVKDNLLALTRFKVDAEALFAFGSLSRTESG